MTTGQPLRVPTFHADMRCGACGGPLEDDRNAVCHTCTPESVWFDQAAAAQEFAGQDFDLGGEA